MARPRTPQPPIHLRSARMLDVDAGELVEPGDLLVEGDRIVDVAPTSVPADADRRSTSATSRCCPGLMDMEVNLLLGGPDHASPLNPVQDDPALQTLRAVANARPHAARRVHDGAQPRPVRPDRRAAARRRAEEGDRLRLDRRPARRARRPRHLPDRRAPRPDDVPGARAARPAADRRGGHRQRRQRGAQGRPLPDQVRRPAHQGVRVGRGDVAHRSGRRAAVLQRGAAPRSPTRRTAPG